MSALGNITPAELWWISLLGRHYRLMSLDYSLSVRLIAASISSLTCPKRCDGERPCLPHGTNGGISQQKHWSVFIKVLKNWVVKIGIASRCLTVNWCLELNITVRRKVWGQTVSVFSMIDCVFKDRLSVFSRTDCWCFQGQTVGIFKDRLSVFSRTDCQCFQGKTVRVFLWTDFQGVQEQTVSVFKERLWGFHWTDCQGF